MEEQTGLQLSTTQSKECSVSRPVASTNYPEKIRKAAEMETVIGRQEKEIGMMIVRILFLLCIPKDSYPSKNETNALIAYIREKQARFSCESIVTAFELYIDRQLDIMPKEYVRFGPMLIADVMGSYTRYSFNTLHNNISEVPADEMDKIKASTTPAQLEEKIKADCISAFDRFRNTGKLFDPGNFMYRFLVRKEILNFSQDRKKEIRGRVNQLNMGIFKRALGGDIDQEERLRMAARELALMEFFNDLIDTNTELSELFENKPTDVHNH